MDQHYPQLPPLYFLDRGADLLLDVPAELISSIISYLAWDDFMRVAQVNSTFKDIVKDSTIYGGPEAKWSLAEFLLKREDETDGSVKHPSLAIKLLKELAGSNVSSDEGLITPSSYNCEPYPKAIRQLATCYLTGLGVIKDASIGLKWLELAHRHGDVDAAYDIAKIYESGLHDTPVDIFEAAKWFEIAALAGHVEAMVEYALCLELGCGVALSEEEALDWYTKAAEQGHVTANYSVGEMFEDARAGLPQSDTEAVLWYFKAAVNGDDDSIQALMRLNDVARIIIPGWSKALTV